MTLKYDKNKRQIDFELEIEDLQVKDQPQILYVECDEDEMM